MGLINLAKNLTSDEVLVAMGIKTGAPNVAAKPISLSQMSQLLEFMNNPLVQKYLDLILARLAKRVGLAPTSGSGAGDLSQKVQIQSAPIVNLKGEDVYDFFLAFMRAQQPEMKVGDFTAWLADKRGELVGVMDRALVAGGMAK
jgi:hypothetical protein